MAQPVGTPDEAAGSYEEASGSGEDASTGGEEHDERLEKALTEELRQLDHRQTVTTIERTQLIAQLVEQKKRRIANQIRDCHVELVELERLENCSL